MQSLIKNVRPGITTQFLDEVAKKEVLKYNASCSFKGYEGYPAHICTSINEEIVHGIPSPDRVLKEGDIITWINNQEINANNDLANIISSFNPGETINITYLRKCKTG